MKNAIFLLAFFLISILACKTEKITTGCDAKNYPSIDFNGTLYVQPAGSPGFSDPKGWQGAVDYCNNLDFDGCDDWYLPSKDELYAIYQNKATIGDFDDMFGANYYWSATTKLGSDDDAWQVRFYTGATDYTDKSRVNNCRCVRR